MRKRIAIGAVMAAVIMAAGAVWFRQYVYWSNTGHVEYDLFFAMANHIGLALLICVVIGLVFRLFGKGFPALVKGVGTVLLCCSVLIMLELLIRWTGAVQNYGEIRDGRYISQYDDSPRSAYYTYGENATVTMESGTEFRFERTSNSIGLLFNEELMKPRGLQRRVIALGDSFTAGDGAHEDSTWVAFMHRQLIHADERFVSLEVLNAGVQGSDPVYQYKLLSDKLLNLGQDLVILAINNTDIGEIGSRGGFERFINDTLCVPRSGPWWEPVYASSHVTRLLLQTVFGINYSLMTKDAFERNQENCAHQLRNVIGEFEKLADYHDFRLLVCFLPIAGDVRDGDFLSLYGMEQQVSYSNKGQVTYLDLFPHYLEAGMTPHSVNRFYWPVDGHHKAEGYQVLGSAIGKQIVDLGLLPVP